MKVKEHNLLNELHQPTSVLHWVQSGCPWQQSQTWPWAPVHWAHPALSKQGRKKGGGWVLLRTAHQIKSQHTPSAGSSFAFAPGRRVLKMEPKSWFTCHTTHMCENVSSVKQLNKCECNSIQDRTLTHSKVKECSKPKQVVDGYCIQSNRTLM